MQSSPSPSARRSGTASGDSRFRKKYWQAFRNLQDHASFVIVSHQTAPIEKFCQKAAVLHDGALVLYDSVEAGLKVYNSIAPEQRKIRRRRNRGREKRNAR